MTNQTYISNHKLSFLNGWLNGHLGYELKDNGHSPALIKKYLSRSQAIINTLDQATAEKATNLWMDALQNGILLLIYSGYRDYPEQWELRKKYLSGGAKAARPGESWHNFKRAFDTVPITAGGKADWSTKLYPKITQLAKKYGLKWGGSFSDKPHYYNDSGTSLYLLRNNKPGWEKYHQLEKQLQLPAVIKSEETYIDRDNKVIFKKVVAWSVGLGILTFFGYKIITKWK